MTAKTVPYVQVVEQYFDNVTHPGVWMDSEHVIERLSTQGPRYQIVRALNTLIKRGKLQTKSEVDNCFTAPDLSTEPFANSSVYIRLVAVSASPMNVQDVLSKFSVDHVLRSGHPVVLLSIGSEHVELTPSAVNALTNMLESNAIAAQGSALIVNNLQELQKG